MKLKKADKKNFATLRRAFAGGDVALVDVRRRADKKPVAAICAVGFDGKEYALTPFAIMVEGNPFELFDPPDPDSRGHY
jgi:hypothetical protein